MLANDSMVDYLLRRPDDDQVAEAVRKTGEFLLDAQLERDGKYMWAYRYAYGDNPGDPRAMRKDPDNWEPHPVGGRRGAEEFRFLTFLTQRTGDPRYLEALQRTWDTAWTDGERGRRRRRARVGYTSNKIVQHLPYAQAHKWQARLEDGAVRISPLLTARWPSLEGTVSTPFGPLELACSKQEDGLHVETRSEGDFDVLVDLPGGEGPERMSSNETRTFS
jgi:hypothetical protein